MSTRPHPAPITGHWHGWKYVLGTVADCPDCGPVEESAP